MRILAIDQGTNLGWATNTTGSLIWGTEKFPVKSGESDGMRWIKFSRWLTDMTIKSTGHPQIDPTRATLVDLIVHEGLVRGSSKMRPNFVAAGFVAQIQEHCARYNEGRRMEAGGTNQGRIECTEISASELKKFATGKGNVKKDKMVSAALMKLYGPVKSDPITGQPNLGGLPVYIPELTDNEADALWLFWCAEKKFGT